MLLPPEILATYYRTKPAKTLTLLKLRQRLEVEGYEYHGFFSSD